MTRCPTCPCLRCHDRCHSRYASRRASLPNRRSSITPQRPPLPAPPVPGEPLPLPQSFYAPQRKIGGGVPLHSGVAASEAVPPLPAVPLPQQPLPTPESARLPAGTVNSHTEVGVYGYGIPARVESPPASAVATATAQPLPHPQAEAAARLKFQPPSRPLSQPPLLVINSTQNLNTPPVVPLRRPASPEIKVELSVVAPPTDARRTSSPGPQRPQPVLACAAAKSLAKSLAIARTHQLAAYCNARTIAHARSRACPRTGLRRDSGAEPSPS